jgi:hypothetical protein
MVNIVYGRERCNLSVPECREISLFSKPYCRVYFNIDAYDYMAILHTVLISRQNQMKQTPWPQSTSELYRLSDRRLSAKLVPTVG